jgi:chromosome segregation ATPase
MFSVAYHTKYPPRTFYGTTYNVYNCVEAKTCGDSNCSVYTNTQKLVSILDACFNKHEQDIADLKKKNQELLDNLKVQGQSQIEILDKFTNLTTEYQQKLDKVLQEVNQQIKTHEENIKELTNNIKIEQEEMKKQIDQYIKINNILDKTNKDYIELSNNFIKLIKFLKYILTGIHSRTPELIPELESKSGVEIMKMIEET